MTENNEDIKKKVNAKKKEVIKKAEACDRNVENLDEIQKANKIIYFAEDHIKLCKAVIEKSNELFKIRIQLWEAESSGKRADIDKYKKQITPLEKDFKGVKAALLKRKQDYSKDEDLKKELKKLSKIPTFLRENYH